MLPDLIDITISRPSFKGDVLLFSTTLKTIFDLRVCEQRKFENMMCVAIIYRQNDSISGINNFSSRPMFEVQIVQVA